MLVLVVGCGDDGGSGGAESSGGKAGAGAVGGQSGGGGANAGGGTVGAGGGVGGLAGAGGASGGSAGAAGASSGGASSGGASSGGASSGGASSGGASSGGASSGGTGGSTSVVAAIECRSFGQTAKTGGSLLLKYATPISCWATGSTVGGAQVNEAGFVPEVFFDWDWDDSSLGSVTRGGIPVDLGKSVGLVAAHAFQPSTFSEACGGGQNSLHTVKLTVTALVNGVRQSDTATLSVCVENPATTWPKPVAFCNDSDCSNDPGVPPGTVHGGNGTDLATILRYCETHGSQRVLLKGGVTFSTASANLAVGGSSCLIESYGTGRAKLKFTSASSNAAIVASNAACAGYRLRNLTFAGSGSGPRIIGGGANTGCYALIEGNVSMAPGDEFSALSVVDPPGNAVQSEGYYFKFDYTKQADSGLPAVFLYGNYTAFVGGEISGIDTAPQNNEHNMRFPQWQKVVIDAMRLADQEAGRHLIALRQDCGGATSCPNSPSASVFAITRNELRAAVATTPVQVCTAGSGSSEQTKCYDGDLIRNLGLWASAQGGQHFFFFESGGSPGSEVRRIRAIQNAIDLSALDSSTMNVAFRSGGTLDQVAFLGNVVYHAGGNKTWSISNLGSPSVVAKNNVCYESGAGKCDLFPALTESADNRALSVDAFDAAPGEPASLANFGFPELRIGTASALRSAGVLDPVTSDVEGHPRPQGVTDPGVYEVN